MSLVLNTEDVPDKKELEQAVSRLRKCTEILSRIRSKKHKDEDPEALKKVANFLEMILKK